MGKFSRCDGARAVTVLSVQKDHAE